MLSLLLVACLTGLAMSLPLPDPDAKIYFPGENIDPRSGYSQPSGQVEQRTYYTKSSGRKGGGYQSPIQWSQAVGEDAPSYGQPSRHSSYGHHPQHHSYSSLAYGTDRQSSPHSAHSYQSHSYSYGGTHSHNSNGGSVDGQIEQVSHGSDGLGSSGSLDYWHGTGHHDIRPERVVETSYGQDGIEQILDNSRVEDTRRPGEEARGHEEEARRHEEEARRTEDEARRIEEEARRTEEETRRHAEEARKTEEETRRHEEQARRTEYEARRHEEQTRRIDEEARRPEEEARQRTEDEARRIEEEARRTEEETRRHAEEARRTEYEARRHEEEARRIDEEARRPEEGSSYAQHTEGQAEEHPRPVDGGRPVEKTSLGQHAVGNEEDTRIEEGKKAIDADIAAEEHRIVQELEQLVGMKSQPDDPSTSTKNPITQTQEIIREMNGWSDPHHKGNAKGEEDNHQDLDGGAAESGSSNTALHLHDRAPEEHQVHHRQEVMETPMKQASYHENQVVHTEVREELHNQMNSHKKSTPDPLDLINLYNEYNRGDFQPGHGKKATVEPPKTELKPEIKQAIDNIMRDWEVLPDREGKPQPPPRKYKITKHVKVTTTTHNHPVVVHPSQTITKTVRTHTYEPSSSHHRQVVTHHINIAELLEQLRQLESSPQHRNVTWCEEKIKEFLTELNRKEESGIEINQSVQEETLHHILSQDQTIKTITKETHHEVGLDGSGAVEEEPFVKKTVVELGQNEPTKPPSYWTEQETKHETHSISNDTVDGTEPHEIKYETSEKSQTVIDESQVITVTPSPHNVPPLEALSHQSHTSSESHTPSETKDVVSESNENHLITEHVSDMDHQGSEPEGVTVVPVRPIPELPGRSDTEEFRGEKEKHERPLPADYKPRDRSEETTETESGHLGTKEHRPIDDLSIELPENVFSHEEGKVGEHESNNLPTYEDGKSSSKEETKTFIEHEQENAHPHPAEIEHQNPGYHNEGHVKNEAGDHQEQIVHEFNTGEHPVGKTEYVVETEHSSSGGNSSESNTNREEGMEHHSQGYASGGNRTEYVKETVEHSGGNHGHQGGGVNTEYAEETVHHSSGGGSHSHTSGGSQTEYVEETVEHHTSEGNHEINYDQLIEELISLESLPGHQAIDKCEEKIRHFLEVLRRQQERGFDQNKAELQRLRLLLEEIQTQKQNQQENSATPQNTESANSFWKKIGRKIKTTFEKAKTKAHDTVNNMMN